MDKDFLKDGLDNDDIIKIVKKIRKVIETPCSKSYESKVNELQTEYESFIERYPILFDMATRNDNFDWNFFNYFMNMRTKIINDELTTEKASVIVGQNAYDKYVKNDEKKEKKRKTNT
jgi:hypothetical protein